jgi:hypothetical protein
VEEVVMKQKRNAAPTPNSTASADAADDAVPSRDRAA